MSGAALGSLQAFSSLEALKIHSLYPPTFLHAALGHLTALTSLDLKVQVTAVDLPRLEMGTVFAVGHMAIGFDFLLFCLLLSWPFIGACSSDA